MVFKFVLKQEQNQNRAVAWKRKHKRNTKKIGQRKLFLLKKKIKPVGNRENNNPGKGGGGGGGEGGRSPPKMGGDSRPQGSRASKSCIA